MSSSEKKILERLQQAAKTGRWDYVDTALPSLADDEEILHWAETEGLNSPDEDLRDLAASVFEQSDVGLSQVVMARLVEIVNAPTGKYDRFRAACALLHHGIETSKVIERITEFRRDPDVAAVAERYLKQL